MLDIRPATSSDIPALAALDTSGDAGRVEMIRRWVADRYCLVAVRDGTIVGYGVLTRSFFGHPFIDMLMIGVAFRRAGIGRALLAALAMRAGPEKLFTTTNLSNLPMQRLLEGAGFFRSGQIDNLDDGDPELIYLKRPSQ